MANRLSDQTSPYLRQHADDPVHWWPWGPDAMAEAAATDRPLLISIGYASCHWCHVMAAESFADPDTAAIMNDLFVNVKVDRDEHPDVDAVYLDAVSTMTGRGGWPMTVFALPDGRPFVAGTYFPKVSRTSGPSFTEVCGAVDELWRTRRDDLVDQAAEITEAVSRLGRMAAGDRPATTADADAAADELLAAADPEWGGFGTAPKFPQAAQLELLLRAHLRTGNDAYLDVVTAACDAMAGGGIFDHLGGGFARYSTDRRWHVPHFEKMLVDQATVARVYLHLWQVTGTARHLGVVESVVDYVHGVLALPGGGFATGQDADSEGAEGTFYLWTATAFAATLRAAGFSDDEVAEAAAWFQVTDDGDLDGANVLWHPHRPGTDHQAPPPVVLRATTALAAARNQRVGPAIDDKAVTELNAAWLATLCEAAAATGNQAWAASAVACGEFLWDHLRRGDGRWLRSWQPDGGTAGHLGCAADVAGVCDAFVRLAELTGQPVWVRRAEHAATQLVELFWDDTNGGVFTTGADTTAVVARTKDLTDDATPSANGTAAVALARLGAVTGDERWTRRAEEICALVAPLAAAQPSAFAGVLAAAELLDAGTTEVVVSGNRPDLVAAARAGYHPTMVLVWGTPDESPLWDGRRSDDPGRAYVCHRQVCGLPATDPDTVHGQLAGR